jgi:hypothetical protein
MINKIIEIYNNWKEKQLNLFYESTTGMNPKLYNFIVKYVDTIILPITIFLFLFASIYYINKNINNKNINNRDIIEDNDSTDEDSTDEESK